MLGCCGWLEPQEPAGAGFSPELACQWGYHLSTGGRSYMEDYHTAMSSETHHGKPVGLFAVYDGHGGRKCVRFVRKKLFDAVLGHATFRQGDVLGALSTGFLTVDRQFGERHPNTTCGTTATAAVLYGQTLWIAHVGDSRAVLGTRGGAVTPLTKDHKPDDPFEENRIREKGGSVTRDDVPRVEGVLAVTRAFGNNAMKAVITAEPELLAHRLSPHDEFLIIASDGVWDLISNADAAAIVRRTPSCQSAAEKLTTEAYRLGSMDNISAVVVRLNYQGPWSASQRAATAVKHFSRRGERPPAAGANGNPHGITVAMRPEDKRGGAR